MKTSQPQNDIPNKWQLLLVSEVFTFVKSYAFSRDNLTNGVLSGDKIGNIHYGDIHATYTSENIDLSKIQIPIVKEVGFNPKKEDLLKDGDLIMADASEDYDGIGVTISVHGIGKNKVVGGLHTFVLRDEKGKTSEYYRQYIFLNREIRNKLQKVANGVSVYGISKTALSKMELSLPSLSEQNRIVSVLDTWDKSIEKLEQKIEAKRQIKKTLMQELLTGKTRLKKFKIPWTRHRLGDISSLITKGTTPTTNGFPYQENGVRFIKIESITEDGVLIEDKCAYISDDAHQSLKRSQLREGDILFSIAGALGRTYMMNKEYLPANTNQALAIIRLNGSKGIIKEFIYLYLQSNRIKTWIREINVQMAQANISLGDISNLVVEVPELEEQKEIVEVLTTADKEIKGFKRKLKKLKEQKRYLLNNLITGTIRTPETLSSK